MMVPLQQWHQASLRSSHCGRQSISCSPDAAGMMRQAMPGGYDVAFIARADDEAVTIANPHNGGFLRFQGSCWGERSWAPP
jgi:hypothetical protein